MSKWVLGAAAFLLATISPPLSAKSDPAQDSADVNAAIADIISKKFDDAVTKADAVIKRFEKDKKSDANYRCTNGQADTLEAMLGAAVKSIKDDEEASKSITYAVAKPICEAYFLKGFALIDLGKREPALANLRIAAEMDPDNQHYLNEIGEWHKIARDWPKSLEIFTKASETTDTSVQMMSDKKQSQEILDMMRCRSYRGVAFNHAEMSNWDEARAAIDKCLKLIPGEARAKKELQYIAEQLAKG